MCTAHNHSKYCKCGFGEGKNNFFYSNSSNNVAMKILEDFSYQVLRYFPTSSFSITVPNALCPVCYKKVFFYQNHYGSRVFFDELGPPWPKHPCTDNNEYSYNKKYNNIDIYSKEKNFIPLENSDKNDSIKNHLQWKIINRNEFLNIYDNIYKYQESEYFINNINFLNDDFAFIKEENKLLIISSYNVYKDQITEVILRSKENSIYENKFNTVENDIFYVRFVEDTLFKTKVCTVNRKFQIFEMRINQFKEQTKRKILYENTKDFGVIKVQLKNGKLFEL